MTDFQLEKAVGKYTETYRFRGTLAEMPVSHVEYAFRAGAYWAREQNPVPVSNPQYDLQQVMAMLEQINKGASTFHVAVSEKLEGLWTGLCNQRLVIGDQIGKDVEHIAIDYKKIVEKLERIDQHFRDKDAAQQPISDESLQAQIGEIGGQVHNLGCEYQNDEKLAERLGQIASELWLIAKSAGGQGSGFTVGVDAQANPAWPDYLLIRVGQLNEDLAKYRREVPALDAEIARLKDVNEKLMKKLEDGVHVVHMAGPDERDEVIRQLKDDALRMEQMHKNQAATIREQCGRLDSRTKEISEYEVQLRKAREMITSLSESQNVASHSMSDRLTKLQQSNRALKDHVAELVGQNKDLRLALANAQNGDL